MSTLDQQGATAPVKVAGDLRIRDLRAALVAGCRDFRACPAFGLFFAAIYILVGLFLYICLFSWGELAWLIPASAGFPLLAPFAAVGLYEVSRRRELGLEMPWSAILGAIRGRGDEQIISIGGFLAVAFTFWIFIAHGIFAIFMAESGIGGESLALLGTRAGQMMLVVGGSVGALISLGLYSVTVMSLPMLVDRDVDFITAIIASLATVRANTFVMVAWGAWIAVCLFAAMVPAFLGLFIALPVLGHATWHLYRRAVPQSGI